jgi:hypothetical protein
MNTIILTVDEFNQLAAGMFEFIDADTGERYSDDAVLDPEIASSSITAIYAEGRDKFRIYFERV